MKVILLRHGNTFGEDQEGGNRVFMSGSKNNIPLVETGRTQAREFAEYAIKESISPSIIYANHLIRTWEMGTIVRENLLIKTGKNIPLKKNEGMLELDYGHWAGLTTEKENNEVIEKFGEEAWNNWQEKRIIPNHAPHHWEITAEEASQCVRDFFNFLESTHNDDETVLAIGSQGSIYFANAMLKNGLETALKEGRIKVGTGRFCVFEGNSKTGWQCTAWNQKPTDLL